MRVWVEALQQRRPRDGVKIASQQELPYAQAVFFSIWKDQLVMDILHPVGCSQPSQSGLTVFGGMERKGLAKAVKAMPAEMGHGIGPPRHGRKQEAGGSQGAEEGYERAVQIRHIV